MTDCLVIGGGILGMLTARELVSAGVAVTLVEQSITGRESSWAGGGIVSPLYPWRYADSVTALANWSQAHYPDLADALTAESAISPEYTRNGLLILEPGDEDEALAWAGRTRQSLSRLDKAEIAVCEPALRGPTHSAIWMPQVAQVRNPRLVKALRRAIEGKVEILENTPVTEFVMRRDRLAGVRTAAGVLQAQRAVVCAGAWSGRLLADQASAPRIEPVLGQMILYKAPPGALSRIMLHEDRYVIPRRDGRILVGSTLEHRGYRKTTTREAREALHDFALTHFPLLEAAEIEHHWAGLRPGSPHGIPYIGQVPGIDGLFINAGHFRNGVVLGPASARLLADILLERPPILPAAPYAVEARRL